MDIAAAIQDKYEFDDDNTVLTDFACGQLFAYSP